MGTITKFIYVTSNGQSKKTRKIEALVHVLEGYNSGTLADFLRMAALLRETFPEAKLEDIKCSLVSKSSTYDGHTIISWQGEIKKKTRKRQYPDFHYCVDRIPEYYAFFG